MRGAGAELSRKQYFDKLIASMGPDQVKIVTEVRRCEIPMRPLSFSEFMECYEGDKRDGYAECSVYGGLPAVAFSFGMLSIYLAMHKIRLKIVYILHIIRTKTVRQWNNLKSEG